MLRGGGTAHGGHTTPNDGGRPPARLGNLDAAGEMAYPNTDGQFLDGEGDYPNTDMQYGGQASAYSAQAPAAPAAPAVDPPVSIHVAWLPPVAEPPRVLGGGGLYYGAAAAIAAAMANTAGDRPGGAAHAGHGGLDALMGAYSGSDSDDD